ncbi:MAG: hypothetical protein JO097_20495 [Acidobacteriaceae bacterium]|nr:hypothetical protein [Acidobacteriaceae bacterium]
MPEPGSAILLGGGLIAAGAIGCWRRVRRPCPNLQSKTQPVTPQITTNLRGDRAKDLALL